MGSGAWAEFELCTRREATGLLSGGPVGSAGRSAAARARGGALRTARNMIEVGEQAGEDGCGSHRTPPGEGFPETVAPEWPRD